MIFKRIGLICFGLAFLLAIVLFTNIGSQYIPKSIARIGIIASGAVALLMNLLSFRYDNSTENNLLFWIGSVVVFIGLVFKIQFLPFSQVILVSGILLIGLSYFYNPFSKSEREKDDELLDQ